MKKIVLCFSFAALLLSCNNDKDDKTAASTSDTTAMSAPMSMASMPYTASYSCNWSENISDADLKTVLTTYKDWADGNISNLGAAMADSVWVDYSSGGHFSGTNAELMKVWSTYRDSLSSVTIDMQAWRKMYSTDKKEGSVVTWYKEIDTYKTGKVDSAYYSDINMLKDGKISWYSSYKRPAK
ncbi:MAG: hypothetical protein ABUT20_10375 [Bacteroidota bacterium]